MLNHNTLSSDQLTFLRASIRQTIKECSSRGLLNCTKWLGEQLIGLPNALSSSLHNSPTTVSSPTSHVPTSPIQHHSPVPYKFEASSSQEEGEDSDVYLFAKSLFDLKEYDRCSHVLISNEQQNPSYNVSRKDMFLRFYSTYLSGEQNKERQKLEMKSGVSNTQNNAKVTSGVTGFGAKTSLDLTSARNANISTLFNELARLLNEKRMDSYLLYLYGIILKEMKMNQRAVQILVESVTLNPLLWCSWLEIVHILQSSTSTNTFGPASLMNSQQQLHIGVSPVEVFHLLNQKYQQFYSADPNRGSVFVIMKELFRAKLQVEGSFSQTGSQSHTGISDSETAPATSSTFEQVSQSLLALRAQVFPNSLYLLSELAVTNYHLQRFDKALELFAYIRKTDPYRYEHMHTFSNIFFIRGMRRELSVLGHELHKTHKYKPETCCVLGNYYSMRGEHERAVVYFRRALQLNPSFLSAWTLMGHEYVEMKNTTAAVSAYRTAVDIQPRDYRAWYGLGQTYEILNMPHYALYYYSKASALRPYDGRMWSALAGCYEALEQYRDALRCYQRSRENGEQTHALVKMGELYRKMNDNAQAAHFFTKCLAMKNTEMDTSGLSEEMEAGILLFLAKYNMREVKPPDFEQAKHYCMSLLQQFPNYSQKEHAAQMLKEIQASSIIKQAY